MVSQKSNKEGTTISPLSSTINTNCKVMLMPVSSDQSYLYNIKELNKQCSKMIEEASKAILELQEKTESSIAEAIQTTLDKIYSSVLENQIAANVKKAKKEEKRAKHKNDERKPLSNYMVFCMRNRADVQAANPQSKPTEVSQLLGTMWNKLTPEQKAKFIDTTVSV